MNPFGKYGTIAKDGKIDARFYCDEVDYAACYDIFMGNEGRNVYDLGGYVQPVQGKPAATYDGKFIAWLPTDWTQFVGQVLSREYMHADIAVQWKPEDQKFRVRVDIDETTGNA